ncbi:hypothetical protein TIFTF001_009437 [Ficus carica]|uniref:Uncharacterized protein n=1 Tax=Ficus carica TaxID=3494 RepID=A0AA88D1B4_FICCA|nr:hypothetical protein TIFTF001_009437 [Ficus carica]
MLCTGGSELLLGPLQSRLHFRSRGLGLLRVPFGLFGPVLDAPQLLLRQPCPLVGGLRPVFGLPLGLLRDAPGGPRFLLRPPGAPSVGLDGLHLVRHPVGVRLGCRAPGKEDAQSLTTKRFKKTLNICVNETGNKFRSRTYLDQLGRGVTDGHHVVGAPGGLGHLGTQLVGELRNQHSVNRGLRAWLIPAATWRGWKNGWPVLPGTVGANFMAARLMVLPWPILSRPVRAHLWAARRSAGLRHSGGGRFGRSNSGHCPSTWGYR